MKKPRYRVILASAYDYLMYAGKISNIVKFPIISMHKDSKCLWTSESNNHGRNLGIRPDGHIELNWYCYPKK